MRLAPTAVAVDASGSAYVARFTVSTDFPTANPVLGDTNGFGQQDAFVTKLSPAGSAIAYSTYLGGSSYDEAFAVAVDAFVVKLGGSCLGRDTVGLYTTGGNAFFPKNCNTPGAADAVTTFGPGGWVPIRGDWNGDGVDTVGAYDPSTGCFFLRDSNTPGPADVVLQFGAPGGLTPLVGNWDGR